MFSDEDLQKNRDILQSSYVELEEKILNLRKDKIIETGAAILFQLNKLIEKAEAEQDKIAQKIAAIDRQLAQKHHVSRSIVSNNTDTKTILILAANPKNTSRLRLEEEMREIAEGLQRSNKQDQFKLEIKLAVRQRDFYRAILDTHPQIVHFCGHGEGEDGIVLEDEMGKIVLVQADTLGSLFKLFAKKGVECVVLNACHSEVQAEAISQHINYVIGMNRAIGDKAAIDFAVAFYDALAAGEDVEFAFDLGCSQLIGLKENQTPVLKIKDAN
ncbi:MAG: CHAT domain-containing protein [Calothrix sp. MO_192.B10]|nr:CHAT domain-containing protein [Calothrix sp. MO_192.B10]